MARILLPMFDWGRVGRIVITIERPTPHSKTVPRDDIVAVTARCVGPNPATLKLETRLLDGTIRVSDMQPINSHAEWSSRNHSNSIAHYEGLLPANAAQIDYRVQGEAASTPWYRLTTVPRPKVVEFEKQITPPSYDALHTSELDANLPNVEVKGKDESGTASVYSVLVEKHGNLRVLKGSHIKLLLTVDQVVSLAELHWIQATSPDLPAQSTGAAPSTSETSGTMEAESADASFLTLQPVPNSHRLTVEFDALHSASYKIHLQSLDGGITNDFNPTYELQVLEDQPPRVRWLQPRADSLIATADQILTLQHELADELPLATVTRSVRVHGKGDWQETTTEASPTDDTKEFSVDIEAARTIGTASNSGDLLQRTSHTTWNFDLLARSLKPGDFLEVTLAATDQRGQTGESSVLRINISSTSLLLEAAAPELLRRDVAQRLAKVADKLDQAKQLFDGLLPKDSGDASVDASAKLTAAAKLLAPELRQEIAQALSAVELAASEADDMLSSQALVRTGEMLAALRTAASEPWEQTADQAATLDEVNRQENLKQTHEKLEQESKQASELARHVESLSSYDVLSRHGAQLATLAQAERLLHAEVSDEKQSPEQLQRRQMVLAEQLKTVQKAMLDSLPQLRTDSQKPLQNSVDQIEQQIDSIERFDAYDNRPAVAEMTRNIAEQLERMRLLSQLDGGISNAVKAADQRLPEMPPAITAPLQELANQLSSDQAATRQLAEAQTQTSLTQLSTRRSLQHAATHGDREFAADLGNAQRAIEQLRSNSGLSDKQQSESVREIAVAMSTLQAVYQVQQLQRLMWELLQNERWDGQPTQRAWQAPRSWESLDSRYEQATRALKTAQLPDEILQSLNANRWGDAAQRAGGRLTSRLWQSEPPTSAAADVELLHDQLSATSNKLEEYAQQARLKLAQQAPTISQLAQRAAERVEEVELQTQQLADAIEHDEVPHVPEQLSAIQAQTDALQTPVDSLRQALVDQAESQNLLDRQQLQIARSTDAAIELVDQVAEHLNTSLPEDTQSTPSAEAPSQLRAAAEAQSESAAALQSLAEHYARLEHEPKDSLEAEGMAQQATEPLAEQFGGQFGGQFNEQRQRLQTENSDDSRPQTDVGSQRAYQQAQQLAELAEQEPRRMLEQLERELPTNPPMSTEMSKISEQTARQALDQLEQAAKQQSQLSVHLEQSDPNFKAQMELMLHDVQATANGAYQMLETLSKEAKWTAGASHNEAIGERITQTEEKLRTSIDQARSLDTHVPLAEVQAAVADLQTQLVEMETMMRTSGEELAQAATKEIHENEKELNQRRREMLDRERRIQQQTVRDAQQTERQQQQRLKQLDNEVRQADRLVQQNSQALESSRKQLERQPDQQWLKDQISEREPQLELSRAAQAATKKFRDALEQRAEQAHNELEQENKRELSELKSDNPTAELSGQLALQSAEASRALGDKLRTWEASHLAQPRATGSELDAGQRRENGIEQVVERVAQDLSRASRHEARLDRPAPSSDLAQSAAAIQAVADGPVEQASQQLGESNVEAQENDSETDQASTDATRAALSASDTAQAAIAQAALDLHGLLSGGDVSGRDAAEQTASEAEANPAASPSSSSNADGSPLDGQQKARLLDELDRRLNGDRGSVANDSGPSSETPSGSASEAGVVPGAEGNRPPSTLAEAARRLSQTLSQARQPSQPASSNASTNSTANSRSSNIRPQPSSSTRVLPVDRGRVEWGQLREQAADELLETRRDSLAPRYQKQIDAYFRELAEQGRE